MDNGNDRTMAFVSNGLLDTTLSSPGEDSELLDFVPNGLLPPPSPSEPETSLSSPTDLTSEGGLENNGLLGDVEASREASNEPEPPKKGQRLTEYGFQSNGLLDGLLGAWILSSG
mgnify:CR=1 FL=1